MLSPKKRAIKLILNKMNIQLTFYVFMIKLEGVPEIDNDNNNEKEM